MNFKIYFKKTCRFLKYILNSAHSAVHGEGNEEFEDERKAHAPGDGNGGFGLGAQFPGDSQPEEDNALDEGGDADGGHLVEAHPVQRHGYRQQEGIGAGHQVCNLCQPHDHGRGYHDAQQQREPRYLAVSLFLGGDVHDARYIAPFAIICQGSGRT